MVGMKNLVDTYKNFLLKLESINKNNFEKRPNQVLIIYARLVNCYCISKQNLFGDGKSHQRL